MQELTQQNQELIALLQPQREARIPNSSQKGGENPRDEERGNQNQEQDDEGSSANQNRQPKPSQVVESTKSAVDVKAARLEEELKEMKGQFKAKAARNLDMLVYRTDSLFTQKVNDYPLPSKFKVPQLENFNGLRDPLNYLESFKTIMHL